MASPPHNAAAPQNPPGSWRPLPPPRRNKLLLGVSIAALLLWLGFLAYLALTS